MAPARGRNGGMAVGPPQRHRTIGSTFTDLLKTGFPETRDSSAKAVLAQVEQHDRRRLVQAVRSALSNSQPLAN